MSYAAGSDELTLTRGTDSVAQTIVVCGASQTFNFSELGVSVTFDTAVADTADAIDGVRDMLTRKQPTLSTARKHLAIVGTSRAPAIMEDVSYPGSA